MSHCKVASMAPYGLILSPRSMQRVATAVLSEEAMATLASMRYHAIIFNVDKKWTFECGNKAICRLTEYKAATLYHSRDVALGH